MLQEMTEEWEQCERKQKETKEWIEKSRQNLDSLQNKKRPIREQLALRDRLSSEVAIQRTKVVMAVDKLLVSNDKI